MKKLNVFAIFIVVSMVFTGCLASEKSQTETASSNIASFKLDDVKALFRGPEIEKASTLSKQFSIRGRELKHLYSLLDNGQYREVHYFDDDGNEKVLVLSIEELNQLSSRFILLELANRLQLLVDLQDGSVKNMSSYDLRVRSAVLHMGYLFSFSSDLKQLKRIKISDGDEFVYKTFSDNRRFMIGERFVISDATIWWDDDDVVDDNSKNFRSILIDENLNLIVQVTDPDNNNFPTHSILADGTSSQLAGDFQSLVGNTNNLIAITQTSNGSLYVVRSLSGPYTHGLPSSPDADDVDYTLSKVSITLAGFSFTQIQQEFPYTVLASDSKNFRCRSDYTFDVQKRFVLFPNGVMAIDSSGMTPSFNFSFVPFDMKAVLFDPAQKPSNSCYISGRWLYHRNSAQNKIVRRDMMNPAVFAEETVVTRAGIKAFYITGNRLHYSTATKSFKVKIDGTDDSEFSHDPDFKFKDNIEIH